MTVAMIYPSPACNSDKHWSPAGESPENFRIASNTAVTKEVNGVILQKNFTIPSGAIVGSNQSWISTRVVGSTLTVTCSSYTGLSRSGVVTVTKDAKKHCIHVYQSNMVLQEDCPGRCTWNANRGRCENSSGERCSNMIE